MLETRHYSHTYSACINNNTVLYRKEYNASKVIQGNDKLLEVSQSLCFHGLISKTQAILQALKLRHVAHHFLENNKDKIKN